MGRNIEHHMDRLPERLIDFPEGDIIPYGPGTPYETVDDLPENCVFLAPNGGVYFKQGETITPILADIVYNGEAVTYGGASITLAYDNFQKNISNAESDSVICSLGLSVSTYS
jgi:hypothetical protein